MQEQPRTPEVLLLQEACYRGLGEAFSQLHKLPGISFPDWYAGELRGLLLLPEAGQVRMPMVFRMPKIASGAGPFSTLQSSGTSMLELCTSQCRRGICDQSRFGAHWTPSVIRGQNLLIY